MKTVKLKVSCEEFNGAGFLAWIDDIEGIAVQACSKKEAIKELKISLLAKIRYELGINNSKKKYIDTKQRRFMWNNLLPKCPSLTLSLY